MFQDMVALQEQVEQLRAEKNALASRLDEAEEALRAIRSGEVDALVVYGEDGDRIYTLDGADHTYRVMIEAINEGAATLDSQGIILYSNRRLAEMLGAPLENILGADLADFLERSQQQPFETLLEQGLQGSSRGEFKLVSWFGEPLPVQFSMSLIQIEKSLLISLLVTDLTEQKHNEAILESERMARSILDQAAESILVCDSMGVIIRASQAAFELARTNLLYRNFDEVFRLAPGDREIPADFSIDAVLQGSAFWGIEVRLLDHPTDLYLLLSATPLRGVGDVVLGCTVSMTDISQNKLIEQALRNSRQRLEFSARATGIGFWEWDLIRDELIWDTQCREFFNLGPDDVIEKPRFFNLIQPSDAVDEPNSGQSVGDSQKIFEIEYPIQQKSGDPRLISIRGQWIYDSEGRAIRMVGVLIDITDRRRMEEHTRKDAARIEVQRRLIEQREQERLRIARELHDGPLQELIATTFDLQGAIADAHSSEEEGTLRKIQANLQGQIANLRDFSLELRSPALAKFGLEKAIRSHLGTFQEKYPDIHLRFSADLPPNLISDTAQLGLYRIYQELVNNVGKHSAARKVSIRLQRSKDSILLQVEDDGRGFNLPQEWLDLARHGHLGLLGIRERVEALGGNLAIHSKPEDGTQVQVSIPIGSD